MEAAVNLKWSENTEPTDEIILSKKRIPEEQLKLDFYLSLPPMIKWPYVTLDHKTSLKSLGDICSQCSNYTVEFGGAHLLFVLFFITGGSVCLCVPQMTYFLHCHPGRCANRACSRRIVLLTSSLHNFLVKPKLIKLPCVLFAMVAIWCYMMLTAEWISRTSRADQRPPTFIFFLRIFKLRTKHEWNLHRSAPTPWCSWQE